MYNCRDFLAALLSSCWRRCMLNHRVATHPDQLRAMDRTRPHSGMSRLAVVPRSNRLRAPKSPGRTLKTPRLWSPFWSTPVNRRVSERSETALCTWSCVGLVLDLPETATPSPDFFNLALWYTRNRDGNHRNNN